MRTIHAKQPGDLVLCAFLSVARVGPTRRPVLRLTAHDPTTARPIVADMEEIPADLDALVPAPHGLADPALAGRPVFLWISPHWRAGTLCEIEEFRAAKRRWLAERKAAEMPRYASRMPSEKLQPWV